MYLSLVLCISHLDESHRLEEMSRVDVLIKVALWHQVEVHDRRHRVCRFERPPGYCFGVTALTVEIGDGQQQEAF